MPLSRVIQHVWWTYKLRNIEAEKAAAEAEADG